MQSPGGVHIYTYISCNFRLRCNPSFSKTLLVGNSPVTSLQILYASFAVRSMNLGPCRFVRETDPVAFFVVRDLGSLRQSQSIVIKLNPGLGVFIYGTIYRLSPSPAPGDYERWTDIHQHSLSPEADESGFARRMCLPNWGRCEKMVRFV